MDSLFLSPQALDDLETIYEYTYYKWSEKQADKYQDEINEGFKKIIANNDIGEYYKYSKLGYQKFQVNRHLIFYRVEGFNLIVVRILHERMNLKDYL